LQWATASAGAVDGLLCKGQHCVVLRCLPRSAACSPHQAAAHCLPFPCLPCCAACPEGCAKCSDSGRCKVCISKPEPMYHRWSAQGWGFNVTGGGNSGSNSDSKSGSNSGSKNCTPCSVEGCVACQEDHTKCTRCQAWQGLGPNAAGTKCLPVSPGDSARWEGGGVEELAWARARVASARLRRLAAVGFCCRVKPAAAQPAAAQPWVPAGLSSCCLCCYLAWCGVFVLRFRTRYLYFVPSVCFSWGGRHLHRHKQCSTRHAVP